MRNILSFLGDLKPLAVGADKLNVIAAINFLRLSRTFVEVGTFRGDFAESMCRFSQFERLHCVDPYCSYGGFDDAINALDLEDVYQAARARLRRFDDRVSFVRKFSPEAADAFTEGSLDVVYIDANHQYDFVLRDLMAWYPKIRSGGLLCGDDVVDVEDELRDDERNVTITWGVDANDKALGWGRYGVLAALREFRATCQVQYMTVGTQFFIVKPDGA